MRQLQDISAWQEYGGRRWETSQQHLSAYVDGWKTPDTRNSTSDIPRALQTGCGSNSLCTSWAIMTSLPMKKTCSALVHLKSQSSKSTRLSIKKAPYYKYFGKESITLFFVTSLWKKIPAYLVEAWINRGTRYSKKSLQAYKKGVGGLCLKWLPCCLFVYETYRTEKAQAMFFFLVFISPKEAVTTASGPAAAYSRALGCH